MKREILYAPTKHPRKAKSGPKGIIKKWNVIVRWEDGTYSESTVDASSASAAINAVICGFTGSQRDAAKYYDAVRVA